MPVSETPSREISLELVELVVQDVLDRADLAGAVLVGDLEQARLGLLEQLAGPGPGTAKTLSWMSRVVVEQPAQQRVLLDDLRVVAGVARRGHEVRQRVDVRGAARLLELALLA